MLGIGTINASDDPILDLLREKMINRDQYGIIGQIQPDGSIEGGDAACWQGHHVFLTDDKDNFPYVSTFEVKFGAYVRHPHPHATNNRFGAYYKDPWNGCISRDQLTGIIAAIVRKGDKVAMLRLMLHHACRLFLFSYNTVKNGVDPKDAKWKMPDLTLLDIWATYLRGFGKASWLLWPLLCVLDIHMLLNTMYSNIQDEDDKINFAIKLLISREFVPTPISWLSSKILNKSKLLDSIKRYWCGWRQNCGMYELYEKRIKEL